MVSLITRTVKRWLNLNAKSIIKKIFYEENEKDVEVRIEKTTGTGHERKFIAYVKEKKYVCQLSLKSQYEDIVYLHRLGREHGVPLPEVVKYGKIWKSLVPVKFMVTEYVKGSRADDEYVFTKEETRSIGKVFGKMHSIGSSCGKKDSIIDVEKKTCKSVSQSCITRYKEVTKEFSESKKYKEKAAIEWTIGEVRKLKIQEIQRMVHGDPHGGNIIIGDKKIYLIDTDSISFGFAPFELSRCLMSNYNDLSIERQKEFIRGYKSSVEERVWVEWKKNIQVIFAVTFLKLAKDRVDFARSTGARYRYLRAMSFWKMFLEVSDASAYQISDLRDIMSLFNKVRAEIE